MAWGKTNVHEGGLLSVVCARARVGQMLSPSVLEGVDPAGSHPETGFIRSLRNNFVAWCDEVTSQPATQPEFAVHRPLTRRDVPAQLGGIDEGAPR